MDKEYNMSSSKSIFLSSRRAWCIIRVVNNLRRVDPRFVHVLQQRWRRRRKSWRFVSQSYDWLLHRHEEAQPSDEWKDRWSSDPRGCAAWQSSTRLCTHHPAFPMAPSSLAYHPTHPIPEPHSAVNHYRNHPIHNLLDQHCTWWTGILDMYWYGSGESMAWMYSIQVASNCQGSSPSFHQASGARGFRTLSRIRSRFSSTHLLRSSNEIYTLVNHTIRTLSLPYKLATWIFNQNKPRSPNGFLRLKANRPLHKSLPKWFRWGGMGYTLPRKSRFIGKYMTYDQPIASLLTSLMNSFAMSNLYPRSQRREWRS